MVNPVSSLIMDGLSRLRKPTRLFDGVQPRVGTRLPTPWHRPRGSSRAGIPCAPDGCSDVSSSAPCGEPHPRRLLPYPQDVGLVAQQRAEVVSVECALFRTPPDAPRVLYPPRKLRCPLSHMSPRFCPPASLPPTALALNAAARSAATASKVSL